MWLVVDGRCIVRKYMRICPELRGGEGVHRQNVRQEICLPLIGLDRKYSGLVRLSFEASAKCDSSPFSGNLGMDPDKANTPGHI